MSTNTFKIIYNLEGLDDAAIEKYKADVSVYFGLDPSMNWFDVLWMTDPDTSLRRRQLYARRGTTDILRDRRKISITEMTQHDGPGYVSFTAKGKDATGREEIAVGAHSTAGLKDEKLAAAVSTAETRAARRLTLKFCGLGILDYTEVTDPVEVKTSPADLAAVAPAPIFTPSLPTPSAAPGKMVDSKALVAADSAAQALAEAEEISRKALSAVVPTASSISVPPATANEPEQGVKGNGSPCPPAPAEPKKRRARKKNTVDISAPGQVSANAEIETKSPSADIPESQPSPTPPPVKCLDCGLPLSVHRMVNSALVCEPKQANPVVPTQVYPVAPTQVNPVVLPLASAAVTAAPHPAHMTMTLPTPPTPHQPILAPPQPSPPTGFPGQPTKEQETAYRERLREYSNVILPGAGMVPSPGVGGPSAKLRVYAERMAGKPTQQMTVEDWAEFFEGMKSFRERNGDKGLVKYINDVIGAK